MTTIAQGQREISLAANIHKAIEGTAIDYQRLAVANCQVGGLGLGSKKQAAFRLNHAAENGGHLGPS